MPTLRCFVITPDADMLHTLVGYIGRTPAMECAGEFTSVGEAFPAIVAAGGDLVFAQADMPQLGGVELARMLPAGCRIVLVSRTPGNAAEVYDAGVSDYLLMPVGFERFSLCVNRIRSIGAQAISTAGGGQSSIFVKSDYRLIQLPLDDILFIEGLKDYVKFYLAQDQRSVMSLMSLKALEAHLMPEGFMRVHRSYIVNLRHIRTIDRGRIVFGPHYIPVGDAYRQQLQQYISSRSVAQVVDT